MTQKLRQEFEVKVSSAQIHKQLMMRKNRKDKAVQEYVLVIREIASRGHIETDVVIQYIIDAIQDEISTTKTLKLSQNLRKRSSSMSILKELDFKGNMSPILHGREVRRRRKYMLKTYIGILIEINGIRGVCFSCEVKGYKSGNCLNKAKGVKCFRCKEFGHISTNCLETTDNIQEPSTSRNVNIIEITPNTPINLNINEISLVD